MSWYEQRILEIEALDATKGGVPRHEYWRYEYYRNPYLLLVTDTELRQRFIDLHGNVVGLTEEGKIAPDPQVFEKKDIIASGWTQAVEALNARGGLSQDLISDANREISKYFESGLPPGVQLFSGRPRILANSVVKFSKREFLEPMRNLGRIRLVPASFYSRGSLLKSMKDFELERMCRIPAVRDALRGETAIVYNGMRMPIEHGAITLTFDVANDYYLFSTCTELDRRMPTDFQADAALIIKDIAKFEFQFKRAFLRQFGRSQIMGAAVRYYDPYRAIPTQTPPEFWKHFSYSYQKEYRLVARPMEASISPDPVFLEIGSMEGYSEIVTT